MWGTSGLNTETFTIQYIFINDIFYFIDKTKIANYADNTTIYANHDNLTELLKLLEKE